MSELGKRVRKARKAAGLSQAELASRIGVKQPTIADLESGESKATKYLLEIARVTCISPDWLATGKGTMATTSSYVADFVRLPEEVQRTLIDIAERIISQRVG